jgi:hypothetical protein
MLAFTAEAPTTEVTTLEPLGAQAPPICPRTVASWSVPLGMLQIRNSQTDGISVWAELQGIGRVEHG